MPAHPLPPAALTIAGSDSSAGAGIQADLKAFSACGVYGLTAVTCVVAERPGNVAALEVMPPGIVSQQIDAVLHHYPVRAVKTGLLGSPAIVTEVQARLESFDGPIVVDPVSIASTGDSMVSAGYEAALLDFIRARATLVTPNRREAETLWGAPISSAATAREAAAELGSKLGCAVLLKGGHFDGEESTDWLAFEGETRPVTGERVPDADIHGTGCTYSAAITARMAQGFGMAEAVHLARRYLHQTLTECLCWETPEGEELKALAHFPDSMHG